MEKKTSSNTNVTKKPSQDDAPWLIGSIIEKGIPGEDPSRPFVPTSAPKPTVLPFPVARHRSHGPHWAPVGRKMGDKSNNVDGDNSDEDNENFTDFDSVASFANPVQRKQKKDLNFSRWRELMQGDHSSVSNKKEKNKFVPTRSEELEKHVEVPEIKSTPIKMDVEPYISSHAAQTNSHDFTGSFVDMELDNLDKLPLSEDVKDAGFNNSEQEQRTSVSTMLSSSNAQNFGNGQGSLTLENQIDAENRARLQSMAPDEIAQAQAELMEKMDPALLKVLKMRGQGKLKKQKCSSSDLATNGELGNPQNENQVTQDAKGSSPFESDIFQTVRNATSEDTQRGLNNGAAQNIVPANSTLWNSWSERVEAVRELRFSLDGTIIENDFAQGPKTGEDYVRSTYSTNNVSERDFLRTDGDPGAAGYTIKEAVALIRSVIPGQRSLALHLLASVLDKALQNICQKQVGCNISNAINVDRVIDWEAVWAFALGPEPELVLSLRMALDDNHNSVVLGCAKVIQCVLSCDVDEKNFDLSEKISTYEKDIYTAPVFRSKPEVDVGFLHGGFWKYNAKPSNILPFNEDMVDEETEGKHTIQDDIFVSGQDIAAGLVRMGILPRIHYLLETDLTGNMEECLISVLIAIARHSPTCANAITNCQSLLRTVVDRFITDGMEIYPSKIKSVTVFKVLARSDKKNCIKLIKNEVFRNMTLHLCRPVFAIDHWVKSGRDYCKLASSLMVEQLRLWKVCIQYGYCVSFFEDFFPSLCLWLNPPTFEKLIESNVLNEFASITREAYLVLAALARRLPKLHSQKNISNISKFSDDETESWSWSHVGPMVDLALKWVASTSNPYIQKLFGRKEGIKSDFVLHDLSLSPLLWVISAVMHMLSTVLERVIPENTTSLRGHGGVVPWLPEFVPKIGLEIVKNDILSFSGANVTDAAGGGSFIEYLCYLRHHSEYQISLPSVCCLHGFVRVVVSVDHLIHAAKTGLYTPSSHGHDSSREGKILENGILKLSLVELRDVLIAFINLVASEWHYVQSVDVFGRGGPAPGVGVGWGASGGGFWSKTVLLAQTDVQLLIDLLEIFPDVPTKDPTSGEETTFTMQKINSVLGVCLTLGPKDRVTMEKTLDILLQVPVLKFLFFCITRFLHINEGFKLFRWEYKEEDYLLFSKILASHFKDRWLSVKKKSKAAGGSDAKLKKGSATLETIPEDSDMSSMSSQDCCTSLLIEWAHQRLPLPMHWFLSPISTIDTSKQTDGSDIPKFTKDPADILEVTKGGLFFLLGIEAISFFLPGDAPSPVRSVPLIWKLHSLSMILFVGMGVLEEEKSRDMYEALQEFYGHCLDKSRFSKSSKLTLENNENILPVESLRFLTEIHDSYVTFIETFVEQFSGLSYGDLIFGRQVAIYLHRLVESPVRLAAWNALSNSRVLELLPPLEKCFAEPEGYLEPVEDDEAILEAYVKSWVSGALDKAATRGSVTYTLVLHHLSCFIFHNQTSDKLTLRNKLVKSLFRDYSRKKQHESMMLDLIRYKKLSAQENDGSVEMMKMGERFRVLTDACEGNSALLIEVEKLKICML